MCALDLSWETASLLVCLDWIFDWTRTVDWMISGFAVNLCPQIIERFVQIRDCCMAKVFWSFRLHLSVDLRLGEEIGMCLLRRFIWPPFGANTDLEAIDQWEHFYSRRSKLSAPFAQTSPQTLALLNFWNFYRRSGKTEWSKSGWRNFGFRLSIGFEYVVNQCLLLMNHILTSL